MAGLIRAQGRPMVHNLPAMIDATGYATRSGVCLFVRWSARKMPIKQHARLIGRNAHVQSAVASREWSGGHYDGTRTPPCVVRSPDTSTTPEVFVLMGTDECQQLS